MAEILTPSQENIQTCAKAIQAGGIVGIPTETVYGLAADVFNEKALGLIYQTKDRPSFNPLIVHVQEGSTLEDLEKQNLIDLSEMEEPAKKTTRNLIQKFWPGPLTLVLPKNKKVPDLATAGLKTVAIRMPKHPVTQNLLRESHTPLAAPSANRSGKISPTSAQAVLEELNHQKFPILDGGPSEIGLESTVLSVEFNGTVRLLRPGSVTEEQIIEVAEISGIESAHTKKPKSPGMSLIHYAPSKPLLILPSSVLDLTYTSASELIRKHFPDPPFQKLRAGVLLMSGDASMAEIYLSGLLGLNTVHKNLSQNGNLTEIAKNLFKDMRAFDAEKIDFILVEPCPSEAGLGYAIMDRLKRAQTKSNS